MVRHWKMKYKMAPLGVLRHEHNRLDDILFVSFFGPHYA